MRSSAPSVDRINPRFAAACAAAGLRGLQDVARGRVGLAVELTARGDSTHAIPARRRLEGPPPWWSATPQAPAGAKEPSASTLRSPGGNDRLAGARPTGPPADEICQYLPSAMPAVNPEILVWARRTAGLKVEDAVTKLGITDARLAALERGDRQPTRPVLIKMARYYRRPLIAFYLSHSAATGRPRRRLPHTAGGAVLRNGAAHRRAHPRRAESSEHGASHSGGGGRNATPAVR